MGHMRRIRILDLVLHLPSRYIERFENTSLKTAKHGDLITVEIDIIEMDIRHSFYKRKIPSKIISFGINDEKDFRLDLVYYNMKSQYLKDLYKINQRYIVSGRFDNSSYASSNDVITNGITINGNGLVNALTIVNNDINVQNGNIKLAAANHLLIGALLELAQFDLPETTGPGSYPTWDLRDPGATSNTVGGVVLPHLTAAGYTAIGPTTSIPQGTLVFTQEDAGGSAPLRLWWDAGAGATWWKINMTV